MKILLSLKYPYGVQMLHFLIALASAGCSALVNVTRMLSMPAPSGCAAGADVNVIFVFAFVVSSVDLDLRHGRAVLD